MRPTEALGRNWACSGKCPSEASRSSEVGGDGCPRAREPSFVKGSPKPHEGYGEAAASETSLDGAPTW